MNSTQLNLQIFLENRKYLISSSSYLEGHNDNINSMKIQKKTFFYKVIKNYGEIMVVEMRVHICREYLQNSFETFQTFLQCIFVQQKYISQFEFFNESMLESIIPLYHYIKLLILYKYFYSFHSFLIF